MSEQQPLSAALLKKRAELVDPSTYQYYNDQVTQHCQCEAIAITFDFDSFTEAQLLSRTRLPEEASQQVIAAIAAICRQNEYFAPKAQAIRQIVCHAGDSVSLKFAPESGQLHYTFDDKMPGSSHYNTIKQWLENNL